MTITFPDANDLAESNSTPRSHAAVTTLAGDWLVVEVVHEDTSQVAKVPTCTGLTFTEQTNSGTVGSKTRVTQFTAPDATGGSRVVDFNSGTGAWRSRLTVVRGSSGPGGKAANASAQSVSMARTGTDSAVFMSVGDWAAGSLGTPTWTPGGSTTASQQGTQATYVMGLWYPSGAPATVSHGISSPSYTTPSVGVLEMLDAGGSSAVDAGGYVPVPYGWLAMPGPFPGIALIQDPRAFEDGAPDVSVPEVVLTPAEAAWSGVDVAPVPQPVALTLTVATGTWAAIGVAPAPGQVGVSATPATAGWSAVAVTPTPQPVALTLTPATATWSGVILGVGGSATLTPATASWAAVAVTATPGQVALTLTPATAAWSAVAQTVVAQVALARPTATWTAVTVSPVPQAVQLTLTPATATWTALAGALQTPGALTIISATAAWTAVPLSPVPQPVARTLAVATGTWAAVPVVPVRVVQLIAPVVTWTARALTPTPGSVALTVAPAVAVWSAVEVAPGEQGSPGVTRGIVYRAGVLSSTTQGRAGTTTATTTAYGKVT